MRLFSSIVIVVALVVCFGCAENEPAPVEQPEIPAEAQVDTAPVANEDFEAGEVGDTMTVGDGEADSEEEGSSH